MLDTSEEIRANFRLMYHPTKHEQVISEEIKANSQVTFFYRFQHMDTPTSAEQQYQLCVDTELSLEDLPRVMGSADR